MEKEKITKKTKKKENNKPIEKTDPETKEIQKTKSEKVVPQKTQEIKKETKPKQETEDKTQITKPEKSDLDKKNTEEIKEQPTDKKQKETKKKTSKEIEKKEKAIVNAYSLRISPKNTKAICKMIRRKNIEKSIELLEKVIKRKHAVKMTGLEVPHRKGKGMAGGRYPIKTAQEILQIVKQLKANSIINGIEEPIITIAMSNKASSPMKRGGRQAKRTHLYLEAQEKNKLIKNKK